MKIKDLPLTLRLAYRDAIHLSPASFSSACHNDMLWEDDIMLACSRLCRLEVAIKDVVSRAFISKTRDQILDWVGENFKEVRDEYKRQSTIL